MHGFALHFPAFSAGGNHAQKVAVLTDSTASIPEDTLKELNIHTVAYYIHRGQEVLRDLVTIQREEFLNWLMTAKFLPTTASPGPGDYFEAYESLIEEGHDEIVSIHMTSKASGAYQAALVAQSMLKEKDPSMRVEVIDTRKVSLCQGWMAIEAARAALAGKQAGRGGSQGEGDDPDHAHDPDRRYAQIPVHGRPDRQGPAPGLY